MIENTENKTKETNWKAIYIALLFVNFLMIIGMIIFQNSYS